MSNDWRPPSTDPFVDLADDARHTAAVRSRAEERQRSARASEVATWVGTLRDLAEREVPVVVQTRSGRTHRGALVGLAGDHVVLRATGGALVRLRAAAVRTVRPDRDAVVTVAAGERAAADDRCLVDVLDRLVEEGLPVVLVVRDVVEPVQGTVVGAGEDVLSVRLTGPERSLLYVPLDALDELILEP